MKMIHLTVLLVLQTWASLSFAHVHLAASLPEDGAKILNSPKQLALRFTDEVRLVKLNVIGPQGNKVAMNFKASAQPDQIFSLTLPKMSAGQYTVNWMVIGGDSHKVKGEFGFMVQASNAAL